MITPPTEGFDLSQQQRHVWRLQYDGSFYFSQIVLAVEPVIEVGAVRKYLNELAQRHEILRATFHRMPGMTIPLQVVHEQGMIPCEERDLRGLSDLQLEEATRNFIDSGMLPPDSFENLPLIKAALLRISDHKQLLKLQASSLCADAQSMILLAQEFDRLCGKQPLEEPAQYLQYCQWQSDFLESEEGRTGSEFWKQYTPTAGFLPFEVPAETLGRFEPLSHRLAFSATTALSVLALASIRDSSPASFFLACFAALFWRLTNFPTMTIGVECDGRPFDALQDIAGSFAWTLPVELHLHGDLSFADLIEQAERATVISPENHAGRASHDSNGLHSFSPAGFVFRRKKQQLGGHGNSRIECVKSLVDRFKLKLSCSLLDGNISAELAYDPATFDAQSVNVLAEQFELLVQHACQEPLAPVRHLGMLSESRRVQILENFAGSKIEQASAQCIHAWIERVASESPHRVAVMSAGTPMTYPELNTRANRLAHYLQRLGVGPDIAVGICVERSLEMVVGILAILKAGGAYVPLNPKLPPEQLNFILKDAGVFVVLCQAHLKEQLAGMARKITCLDSLPEEIAQESSENPVSGIDEANIAYIIYTSGSTGQPKGVLISHHGLVSSTRARMSYYARPVANFVLVSPFFFDSSVAGIFWTLCHGGTLTLPAEQLQDDLPGFIELISTSRATHILCVPSLYNLILQLADPKRIETLEVVILAGEVCQLKLVDRHMQLLPETKLFNEYGPTEATVWSSVYQFPNGTQISQRAPIGRPIENTQVYIVDERMDPVPIGTPGELHLASTGLARGYINRPDSTAEKFVPNPMSSSPGSRLYRTGDLARFLPDGNMEFLGRIDNQVKIRGYRIELEEIEAALKQHTGVQDAAVAVKTEQAGDAQSSIARAADAESRLVAYLVARTPATSRQQLIADVRQFLQDKLAPYMLPSAYMILSALPLNANGKLDRKALPQPVWNAQKENYVAPRNPAEEALSRIWSRVLKREKVGIRDNFFETGGDSILSIQIVSLAQQAGIAFELRDLVEHPTIERLAQAIPAQPAPEALCGTKLTAPFALVSDADRQKLPRGLEDAYPPTRLQAGMLFHTRYSPHTAVYHDIDTFHVQTMLDVSALRQAIQKSVARHPVLRTSFDLVSYSQPLQLVHPEADVNLALEDISHLSADEQDLVIKKWMEEEKQHGFDLSHAPLMRIQVHRRSSQTFTFSLSLHHVILDGWSLALLLAEIFQDYISMTQGNFEERQPLATSFRDYVALERETVHSQSAAEFWRQQLENVAFSLPNGKADEVENSRPSRLPVAVSDDLSEALKHLAGTAGVSIKSVLLAAHLRVMRLVASQPDVITGLISNGRLETKDGDRVLGLFLNPLPLRMNMSGGTWLDLVRAAAEAEQRLLPYRRFPLTAIQGIVGGGQLIQTAFNFTHYHIYKEVQRLTGLNVLGVDGFEETNFMLLAQCQLDMSLSRVQLNLDYNEATISGDRIKNIAGYYLRTLEAMTKSPEQRYDSVCLLSDGEQRQLEAWNHTEQSFAAEGYIPDLIEEQARKRPHATAVIAAGIRTTWAELNGRANQLSHYLRGQGVGPETLVGVSMERSLELVIALLGVLKSGGAYVPVAPEYPAERQACMLEDADVKLILTSEAVAEKIPVAPGVKRLKLDSEWHRIAGLSNQRAAAKIDGDNLAYVIYTSGSTGKPKGAMNTHAGLRNRLLWAQKQYQLGSEDKVLQKTSFSFDVSVWEFFWPLMAGAQLVLAEPRGQRDAEYLVKLMAEEGVTLVHYVRSMLRRSLEAENLENCKNLRIVIASGEALFNEDRQLFYERLKGGVELENLYGPTEASIDVTYWSCSRATPGSMVPIGKPIDNVKIRILDEWLQPVPVSTSGDLYIEGIALARGYHNRPDLTAERFLPSPFGEHGGRLYRTGDLARYREDGNIEYLGRRDQQVKIRGYRIELGEIESALMEYEDIGQCVVLARQQQAGEKRLVAYLTAKGGAQLNKTALRAYLQKRLPEQMVPALFVQVEHLPVTVNGKLDLNALPDPYERIEATGSDAPPTSTEKALCRLWSEVLEVGQVDIHDNFFALGGNSLLATYLAARIERALSVELSVRKLFELPTIAGLAGHLEPQLQTAGKSLELAESA